MTALLFIASILQPDLDSALSSAVKKALDKAAPSIVRVDRTGGGGESSAQTGVAIDSDGLVATSAHALANASTGIVVTLANGERVSGKWIAADSVMQLAFLRMESGRPPAIASAPKERLRVGCYCVAAGRVLAESPTASLGVISALNRVWGKALQTDAKISPANYGGPLLDLEGNAFGVIVPLAPGDDGGLAGTEFYDSGIGFAIPMEDVLRSAARVAKGTAEPGLLGLSWTKLKPLDGPLVVERVMWKSPAAEAGYRKGDAIKKIGGKPIEYFSQFRTAVGKLYAGEAISVEIERGGKSRSATLTAVAKLPVYRRPFVGLRLDEEKSGLVVAAVEDPAAKAGIKIGDVLVELDGPVKSPADVEAKLEAKAAGDAFALVVERSGKREVLAVRSTPWPEAIPPAAAQAKRVAVEFKERTAPFKHWALQPKSPRALIVVVGKSDAARWKDAAEKQSVAVVGSEAAEPTWLVAISTLQRTMKLDDRRTAFFIANSRSMEGLEKATGGMKGGIAVVGGPLSIPPAQPDAAPRCLAIQRRDAAPLTEAIRKAREEGATISEFAVEDAEAPSLADVVARWAGGLGRY